MTAKDTNLQSETASCETVPPVEPSVVEDEPIETEGVAPSAEAEQIAQLTEERDQLQDQLLRLAAEYDNFRKRSRREKDALYEETLCEVSKQWLPLVDNLERALAACDQTAEAQSPVVEGLHLVKRQAEDILSKLGVSEIPAIGSPFDPRYHHAVLREEDPDRGEQEIIDVLERGYRRGDTVIRYSLVKVAN